jgi:hypothetical protein
MKRDKVLTNPHTYPLTLFEDFNQDHLAARRESIIRSSRPSLERTLAKVMCFLKKASISYIVDGSTLLRQCMSILSDNNNNNNNNNNNSDQDQPGDDAPFQNLEYVSLTCHYLDQNVPDHIHQKLLLDAANFSLQLPKLECMELWYTIRGQACLFQYYHRHHHHCPSDSNEDEDSSESKGSMKLLTRGT